MSFKKFYNNVIDEIIVSIDKLENYGETLSEEQIRKYMFENEILSEEQIHFKIGQGMVSNQCNGVGLSKGNIIIYSEDDIIIGDLPSRKNIIELTEKGVICYNKDLLYPYDKENFVNLDNEYFYKKDKGNYSTDFTSYSGGLNLSVTFPCAIMKRQIFTKVYNDISKLDFNFNIEAAFSHVINS